ncbi:cucumisin-like [Impatiens glandulifera]|uniref:cucumisin-like n=1 Tax=Impatiens glandulifera TaxID=253017 RepID=UPI001FB0A642|nr:cucumisin-like [Impatiens glandulifera]
MGDRLKAAHVSATNQHTNILQQIVGSMASESLVHSYKRSFNGFVARLTEEESKKIASMDAVVSVFPNGKKKLHTTRSWDFLGFPDNVTRSVGGESDIIIGMLDTGIWPESHSFKDTGMGPPPSKWKGTCQSSGNFTCNNKIIGAKYYRSDKQVPPGDFASPRDSEGHGTHTASTAAGEVVENASLLGLGTGTARGGVPSARLAVYKICWSDGCYDSDILAAFDDAIADGVDIISLSVGGFFPSDYFEDAIAIGAFHSMKNGVLTSNSAGNEGPGPSSITNFSPWSLSVGASTINRRFVSDVKLGNGKVYEGVAVNTFDLKGAMFPLVDDQETNGTIALLEGLDDGQGPLSAGVAGMIMQDGGFKDFAFSFPLPASNIYLNNGSDILQYIQSSSKPVATIEKSIAKDDDLAPYVVSFSSRGPNPITMDILKPDIAAPGVDILAAWSEATTVTGIPGDNRVVPYNIISGTSMACPHASGAAAYVKSLNPSFSAAAIKSALMTTAFPMSVITNTDAEFAYGSGQINPTKAADPGLVYDATEADFVSFLCGQGYDTKKLRIVTGDGSTCSKANNMTVWDLNYPTFAVSGASGVTVTRVFHRTVTNVGTPVSTYKAKVVASPGLQINVEPSLLSFKSLGEKKSFVVTVSASIKKNIVSGVLIWDDGSHQVRSPVVGQSL